MKLSARNNIEIRRAEPMEAQILSDLAFRSKSFWKYPKDYEEAFKPALQIRTDYIQRWPVYVAIHSEVILGFFGLCIEEGQKRLDHLWIEPKFIGQGIGQKLFAAACDQARELNWTSFQIAADPHAENFYLKLGAVRIGEMESAVRPGFFLPLLEYTQINVQ